MRRKYLIITGVKLLISQWHVNGLVRILRKLTFNLQLTQSSTLTTILPTYYSVKRQKHIFYILNHWVFWELRKKNDSEEKGERRGRKSWGQAAVMKPVKSSSSSGDNTQFGLKWRGKWTRGRKLEIHKACGALH